MQINRRQFIGTTASAFLSALLMSRNSRAQQTTPPTFKIGVCDWSCGAGGPEGLDLVQQMGLDGIEVSAGEPAESLTIADPAYRARYKSAKEKTKLAIPSVAMGLLNNAPLASDPRGPQWLKQVIEATADLGAKNILLAFFGKGDLRNLTGGVNKEKIATIVEHLKIAAPIAEKAGVILGLENTVSAKQNLAIMDQVKSEAVRVYYDIGNSTSYGYDVPTEIKLLGDKICQFHFKDGGNFLGEGDVKMQPVADAIHAIQYKGWIVLETAMPTKDAVADFKKNAGYVRNLMETIG